jgi:hypothetical protein
VVAGAAVAALAIVGFWIASRRPTYLPPPGEQIDILLELAGVFPDNYKIMWREHGVLRSTDMVAQQDPSLLQDALFMHSLTTGSSAEGDVYVEVAYRFYAKDHSIHPDAARLGEGAANLGKPAADQTAFACTCDPLDNDSTRCHGLLEFGNYEFSLSVAYNHEQCADSVNPKRREEFQRSMQTADRLIDLYLKPLRRKPRWL